MDWIPFQVDPCLIDDILWLYFDFVRLLSSCWTNNTFRNDWTSCRFYTRNLVQGIQSAGGELRTRILNKIAGLLKIRSGWHLAEEFSEFDDPSLEYANFQFDNSCNYLHLATELPRDWPFVTLSHSNWLVGRYWRVICVTNEINCNQMFSFFLLYLQRFQRIGIRWRGWGQKKKKWDQWRLGGLRIGFFRECRDRAGK